MWSRAALLTPSHRTVGRQRTLTVGGGTKHGHSPAPCHEVKPGTCELKERVTWAFVILGIHGQLRALVCKRKRHSRFDHGRLWAFSGCVGCVLRTVCGPSQIRRNPEPVKHSGLEATPALGGPGSNRQFRRRDSLVPVVCYGCNI